MPDLIHTVLLRGSQLVLAPLILGCWIERAAFDAERWFGACAELLSLAPGWPGSLLRKGFYAATLRSCASRAYLSFGTLILHRDASVGRDVYIGPYCIIGCVEIGEGVKIASRVSITSGRHQHGSTEGVLAAAGPHFERLSIGAHSWIGEGAIVMASVGRASIVGAGSVVTRPVADGVAVAGNPARPLTMGRLPRPVAEPRPSKC